MPYKNIKDRRAYRRRWYANNKESEKKHIKRRKKEIKKWFQDYKATLKCNRCPEDTSCCLVFHHNGDKDMDVSKMVTEGFSIKRIKEEIAKCEVMCFNCHAKEHNL